MLQARPGLEAAQQGPLQGRPVQDPGPPGQSGGHQLAQEPEAEVRCHRQGGLQFAHGKMAAQRALQVPVGDHQVDGLPGTGGGAPGADGLPQLVQQA